MNWIDISIFLVVSLSVLIGIFRGFIREALSLVNWGLAIFASVYFHELAQSYLKNSIESPAVRSIAAFAAVFIVFIIIGSLLTHCVGFLVRKSGLGGTDRMLGLMFGFVRGVLVSAVLLAVMSFTPVKTQKTWQEAMMLPTFQPLVYWLNDNVSSKMTVAMKESSTLPQKALKHASEWQEVTSYVEQIKG